MDVPASKAAERTKSSVVLSKNGQLCEGLDLLYFSYHTGCFFNAYFWLSQALAKPDIKTFVGIWGAELAPSRITIMSFSLTSHSAKLGKAYAVQRLSPRLSSLGISCLDTRVSRAISLQWGNQGTAACIFHQRISQVLLNPK